MSATKKNEPEQCVLCRGVAGHDCRLCNGIGFKPFTVPRIKLTDGRLFPANIIPNVVPPKLPKK